mmetsp:Transcript_48891/g.93468  ORF Transcript_48891/g.93468 Transcript_48891/m.93468 type:complete len:232 (+) Transcript_48891:763-1458(+)
MFVGRWVSILVLILVEKSEIGPHHWRVLRPHRFFEHHLVDVPPLALYHELGIWHPSIHLPGPVSHRHVWGGERREEHLKRLGKSFFSCKAEHLKRQPRAQAMSNDTVRRVDDERSNHLQHVRSRLLGSLVEGLVFTRAAAWQLHRQHLHAGASAKLQQCAHPASPNALHGENVLFVARVGEAEHAHLGLVTLGLAPHKPGEPFLNVVRRGHGEFFLELLRAQCFGSCCRFW